jgi:hypothetical protein
MAISSPGMLPSADAMTRDTGNLIERLWDKIEP